MRGRRDIFESGRDDEELLMIRKMASKELREVDCKNGGCNLE